MAEFTAKEGRSRTPEQIGADHADLRAGIDDLAGLVAGSLGLPELLAEVAAFAVRAIPGADGAGVTLLRLDRADNMVAALAGERSHLSPRSTRSSTSPSMRDLVSRLSWTAAQCVPGR